MKLIFSCSSQNKYVKVVQPSYIYPHLETEDQKLYKKQLGGGMGGWTQVKRIRHMSNPNIQFFSGCVQGCNMFEFWAFLHSDLIRVCSRTIPQKTAVQVSRNLNWVSSRRDYLEPSIKSLRLQLTPHWLWYNHRKIVYISCICYRECRKIR